MLVRDLSGQSLRIGTEIAADRHAHINVPVAGGVDAGVRSARFFAAMACCGCVCAHEGRIEARSQDRECRGTLWRCVCQCLAKLMAERQAQGCYIQHWPATLDRICNTREDFHLYTALIVVNSRVEIAFMSMGNYTQVAPANCVC